MLFRSKKDNETYLIKKAKPKVQSYVYGLGGQDIFVKDIEKVFEDLIRGNISSEIKYVGIKNS